MPQILTPFFANMETHPYVVMQLRFTTQQIYISFLRSHHGRVETLMSVGRYIAKIDKKKKNPVRKALRRNMLM